MSREEIDVNRKIEVQVVNHIFAVVYFRVLCTTAQSPASDDIDDHPRRRFIPPLLPGVSLSPTNNFTLLK